jgi:hypothetical protein
MQYLAGGEAIRSHALHKERRCRRPNSRRLYDLYVDKGLDVMPPSRAPSAVFRPCCVCVCVCGLQYLVSPVVQGRKGALGGVKRDLAVLTTAQVQQLADRARQIRVSASGLILHSLCPTTRACVR